MKLTVEQEDKIRGFVDGQGLKMKSLRDDIVDHLCCVIESELGRGRSFDELLQAAVMQLAPNGLIEIERETAFLLNYKRIIMKKVMYLTGFVGAVTLTGGFTFKLLHWPGGHKLFMVGFLILLLVFIPLLAFDTYKVAISKALSERLKIIFGVASAVIAGLAGLFKVMHLQGAGLLLIFGAVVFAAGFLPFLFFTMYKKSVSKSSS